LGWAAIAAGAAPGENGSMRKSFPTPARGLLAAFALLLAAGVSEAATFDVKTYGARGDGVRNDTLSIQRAIDAAHRAGGGTVYFPAGEYRVSIIQNEFRRALTVKANVALLGAGVNLSRIKLSPNQGNFRAIIESNSLAGASNFSMRALTIDGNGINNPYLTAEDAKIWPRTAVHIAFSNRVRIQGCRFTDLAAVTGVDVQNVTDVWITGNRFDGIGNTVPVDYDSSIIYTHGVGCLIANNVLRGRALGNHGTRTAIEVHGSLQTVRDNLIENFRKGLNVTGIAVESDNVVVTRNRILNCRFGMVIWSMFYGSNTTEPALTRCTISNNEMQIERDAWEDLGGGPPLGIGFATGANSPVATLTLAANRIRFNPSTRAATSIDRISNGINIWLKDQTVPIHNWRIIDNVIEGARGAGICIKARILGGEISGNTIRNPGRTEYRIHSSFRAAIYLGGNLKNFNLSANQFIDDQPTATMKYGIYSAVDSAENCIVSGNQLSVASGTVPMLFELSTEPGKTLIVQ
jgi:hypothetical protein